MGTYFFCYEGFKREFEKMFMKAEKAWNNIWISPGSNVMMHIDSSWATSLAIPMAGGCAGATAWAFTFPLDCVRASVQGQPISTSQSIQKQGAIQTLKILMETKGFTGLYAGVGPSIARAFLVSGSRFSAYEGALWVCRWSGLTGGDSAHLFEEGPGPYND